MKTLVLGILLFGSINSFAAGTTVCGKILGLYSIQNEQLALDVQEDSGRVFHFFGGGYNAGAASAIASAAYVNKLPVCLDQVRKLSPIEMQSSKFKDKEMSFAYYSLILGEI